MLYRNKRWNNPVNPKRKCPYRRKNWWWKDEFDEELGEVYSQLDKHIRILLGDVNAKIAEKKRYEKKKRPEDRNNTKKKTTVQKSEMQTNYKKEISDNIKRDWRIRKYRPKWKIIESVIKKATQKSVPLKEQPNIKKWWDVEYRQWIEIKN